jgi:chemotaxis protein methyltransferase CheR
MAGEGVYPKDRLQKMSAAQISKYFTEIRPGSFRLQDATRREAQFRIFNLMEAAYSFRRNFHVIFCRNVMIYFNRETTDEVLRKFHTALEPGGYLFVGLAESVDKASPLFRYIEPSVYQKI